jgi:D-alanyl-lipoteichoic acid acyltransferase DltB (MBOAT superfamily)
MSWDYRFGALILISTIIDFILALQIEKESRNKIRLLYLNLSLFLNLICILGFFKYYDFFAKSINYLNGSETIPVLHIILPVGISFFTFQSLSYTIDVYRGELKAEKSFLKFALFVSFFPQLVAGPIVTAKTFLPQLEISVPLENIEFRKAIRYFLMGYIKKVIISDNLSPIVDLIYKNSSTYDGVSLFLGALFFLVQLYGDFSGYSDMAYGSALLLGYHLPENFFMPLKGTSVTDFWRRWHISLTSWLRDYIYISLGGSRKGPILHRVNLFFTMFIAGVWHGANWTFFIWGIYMGIFLVIESILKPITSKIDLIENLFIKRPIQILALFYGVGIVALGCSFFRGESLEQSIQMFLRILSLDSGVSLRPYMIKTFLILFLLISIGYFYGTQIFEKGVEYKISLKVEFFIYPFLILLIALFTNDNEAPFVYFQF